MFTIIKKIKTDTGVLPVILLDSQGEVLEFSDEDEANKIKDLFLSNSDSGYEYEIKRIG